MQINIDKKTGVLLGVIILLSTLLFTISTNRDGGSGFMGMGHGTSSTQSSSDSSYTGADIMFLQMMIPHHQQAVDISNLALKTSKDSELLALAKTIRDVQSAEIIQMKMWLKEAGAGTDMGHSMDGMGGMLDDTELSALAAATGKSFDILWLEGMIGHHDGAIHMTTMINDAQNTEIKTFGENVVKDQSAQIKQMESMLKRLS
jgi:uncharacterized protein (DUF305 family)